MKINNHPFDTVGLSSEMIDSFQEVYETLKAKFNIQHTGYIDFNIESFEVFRLNFKTIVRDSYVLKQSGNDCYSLFVEKNFQGMNPKGGGIYNHSEYQNWALAYLKKDFGRVMIRRETLADKIIELVHPVELDFEDDKAFSDSFYVLVNDRQKADMAMDRDFRNIVMDMRHHDFVIEIINHTLIVGTNKTINTDDAIYLAAFVAKLSAYC